MSLQHSVRLAISDDFLNAFSELPRKIQNKVSEFINRFRQDPTRSGLNYESIKNGREKRLKSVRVNDDYRAIILQPESGNIYLLLWVDKHDQAYDWAKRKICRINQVSGALQIIDVEEVEETTEKLSLKNNQQQTGRFERIEDQDLMRLGVPEILLPAVRQVVTDEDVEELLPHLPREASDAILMLAAGYELQEIFQQLDKTKKQQKVDPDDLETALKNEDTLSRFMVVTDDSELEEMLAAPLEKWRVFLHPTQRKLVERDWNGAVRVLGGAGTGKTVVAIHRAKWLAKNRFTDPNDRIFLTTFTRNLAIDIKANLKTICSPDLMQRILVVNLDSWVTMFLKQEGIETRIVYGSETDELWQQAYSLAPVELALPISFYQEEWQDVVQNDQCKTLRDYLSARRLGRGTRLSRQQRQAIWMVFEEYRNLLRERGLRERDDAMRDAIEIIRAKGTEALPYQAVIVDEAQDMSKAAFSLIRAIAGHPKPNDLFIVGDAHQRIYGQTVTLSHCDIDIRGRSRKLRLNYRTTDETRKWATAVLENISIDDLDGGTDSLQDYRSLMHGDQPIVRGFKTFEEELAYLKQFLENLTQGDSNLSGVCMVFRTKKILEQYAAALENFKFAIKQIHPDQPDNPLDSGIRMGTMHRVKGLQFNYVFIPGLNSEALPLPMGVNHCSDSVSKEKFINGERCLLHVAATRAKKQVIVTYYGQPSSLLVGMKE
jgi:mRNA-degrading endonuclease RelE of RelBE toxin-antitoxin system